MSHCTVCVSVRIFPSKWFTVFKSVLYKPKELNLRTMNLMIPEESVSLSSNPFSWCIFKCIFCFLRHHDIGYGMKHYNCLLLLFPLTFLLFTNIQIVICFVFGQDSFAPVVRFLSHGKSSSSGSQWYGVCASHVTVNLSFLFVFCIFYKLYRIVFWFNKVNIHSWFKFDLNF